jgi:prolyl-tRNA editing enzyme YbaK/EbsC (Cys-tRNA(Pro) deacylase)
MGQAILEAIRALYTTYKVEFREIVHAPTQTSEQSAVVRGEPLWMGGKALVLKSGEHYSLIVVPGDRRLSSAKARRSLGLKKSRFASKEELAELTGLVPGSVPPFGEPILPMPLYVDRTLTENDRIAFNAGSLTVSHIISMDDYLRIARPTLVDVIEPA